MSKDPYLPKITIKTKKRVYQHIKNYNHKLADLFCKLFNDWFYEECYLKHYQKTIPEILNEKEATK